MDWIFMDDVQPVVSTKKILYMAINGDFYVGWCAIEHSATIITRAELQDSGEFVQYHSTISNKYFASWTYIE